MQTLHGCCQQTGRGSEDNSAQLVYPSLEGNRLEGMGTAPKPSASENEQTRMYAVQRLSLGALGVGVRAAAWA